MAIYHLSYISGSRLDGLSAAKKYTSLLRTNKAATDADSVHVEHAHYPGCVADPLDFWKAADAYERVNGRLFIEVEVALPRELDQTQHVALVRDYAEWLCFKEPVQEGVEEPRHQPNPLPYTFAVHHHAQSGNPYARIMLSERPTDGVVRSLEATFKRANREHPELGGALKSTVFQHPETMRQVRQEWARMTNAALEEAGHDARIDHRSLAEQGIDREPTVHMGARATAMERKGLETELGNKCREIKRRNQDRARTQDEKETSGG
jgi:hypothetical protein